LEQAKIGRAYGWKMAAKRSRYTQRRKSARMEMTMAIGRPLGSRKMWYSMMFTITGPSRVRPSGMKRPMSRSRPPTT
jgi:hypothetical protein